MDAKTIKNLPPKVRDLVVWLNEQGFQTTDSGDGSNFENGMEGALPVPMIVIKTTIIDLIIKASDLHATLSGIGVDFSDPLNGPKIEATYDPEDESALIILYNVTSDMVKF